MHFSLLKLHYSNPNRLCVMLNNITKHTVLIITHGANFKQLCLLNGCIDLYVWYTVWKGRTRPKSSQNVIALRVNSNLFTRLCKYNSSSSCSWLLSSSYTDVSKTVFYIALADCYSLPFHMTSVNDPWESFANST